MSHRTSCLLAAVLVVGNSTGRAETPNRLQDLASITAAQQPIPGLSADQWVWSGQEFTEYDDAYQFDGKVYVMLTDKENTKVVLWDPDTGFGTQMTLAEGANFFSRFKADRLPVFQQPQSLSEGNTLSVKLSPGTTFACHPVLSGGYTLTKNDRSISYYFVSSVDTPELRDYKVCSEGELPEREKAIIHFQTSGMIFVPIKQHYTLAFPIDKKGCFLKLDENFHQRGYKAGCPVQVGVSTIDDRLANPEGGSPSFRESVFAPIIQSAIQKLIEKGN